ncbi:MAG: DPP IV N-terminal domain-containing protein [Bacteroidota bacterium]|nr:DPP IV N-terminal domain-containing protein [Bacteroidota bacterium]
MKKIILIFIVAILLGSINGFAQDKRLSVEDATWMNRDLFPKSMRNLQWMGNSNYFAYVKGDTVLSGKVGNGKTKTLLSIDDLNAGLAKIQEDSLKRFPRITWLDHQSFAFTHHNRLFRFNVKIKQLRELNNFPEEANNISIDYNTMAIAYTINNNLYVALEGHQVQITKDEDKGIVNGQSVHRNEFGINNGIFWSPKGNYLAFYRMDETMVAEYPVVDISQRMAAVDPVRYPMAGLSSHEVTLGVYGIGSKKLVFMNTGKPADQYLTCVTWGPAEKMMYIGLLNRDQNHVKMNQYDARTGNLIKTLFEESHDKYVEPESPLYFLETKPELFLWLSERDGFKHLYLYNIDGGLIGQLTNGNWMITNLLGTDPKDRWVFFNATIDGSLNNNMYVLDITNGKTIKLTKPDGSHNGILNKNGKYVIDTYSDTTTTRVIQIVDRKGKSIQVLQEDYNPLADYKLGDMTIFTLKSEDGTDLYCRMIKPVDFEPAKKYPVIVYVYGGPHAQLVTNSWLGGAGLFLNFLATKGYIVFTLDNRGSAHRGLEFEQAVFRNMGILEVEDQMRGIEYLKSLDYVDPERIGADGWSYGGFMTIALMLKQPETFKVGVAGGPVTDWKYYEIMYGERYMDTPEQNPDGYKNASLMNYAHQLEGDLLIIHGTSDPVVVWQHSLDLIKKLIAEGKQVDYFVYPGHGHGVGGKDRLHLNQKIVKYFNDHL